MKGIRKIHNRLKARTNDLLRHASIGDVLTLGCGTGTGSAKDTC